MRELIFPWFSLALLSTVAHAQTSTAPLAPPAAPGPAQLEPIAPPPKPALSPDYQAGFCAGWNSASQVEQQRFGNWRALVMLGQPAPDSPAGVAVGSIPVYILIQPLPPGASLNLSDGRTVVCPATEDKK